MPMSKAAQTLSVQRFRDPMNGPNMIMEAEVEVLVEVLIEDIENLPSGYARELLDRLTIDEREAKDPTLIPDTTIWEALCTKIGWEATRAAGIEACRHALGQPPRPVH